MGSITNGARKTIAVQREVCQLLGLEEEPFVEELVKGCEKHPTDNHLKPDFPIVDEALSELTHNVNWRAVELVRGERSWDDPNFWACARHSAEAYRRYRLHPEAYPDEPMLIYVAGPYMGPSDEAVDRNVQAAAAAGQEIMRRGQVAVVPHTMMYRWDVEAGFPAEAFCKTDLRILERCDAICMIGDWGNSRGAVGELALAHQMRLWVFDGVDEVPQRTPEW